MPSSEALKIKTELLTEKVANVGLLKEIHALKVQNHKALQMLNVYNNRIV